MCGGESKIEEEGRKEGRKEGPWSKVRGKGRSYVRVCESAWGGEGAEGIIHGLPHHKKGWKLWY